MSTPEIVNPVPVEELRRWMVPLVTGLLGSVYDDDFEKRVQRREREWIPERAWGARADGRWVGTLATEARHVTVPAGPTGTHDVPVDALTAVSVAPTHRRHGLLTRMLTASLGAAAERGDALSILIAAEWPIYGRFGYAASAPWARYRLRPRRPRPLLDPPTPGTLSTVEPAELLDIAPDVFERSRRLRPGQVDRHGSWWARRLGQDGYLATGSKSNWVVHYGPDGPDGFLGWHVTRDFDLADNLGALEVNDFVVTTDDSYRDLWAYLCGIDVIAEIDLPDRPVDEPVRWAMSDGRALGQVESGDEVWVRLLDVAAALSARGYSRPGRVVLEVGDEAIGPSTAGRYALEVDESGAATCSRTDASADLRVPQRLLASTYLGGHRLHALAAMGGVDEFSPGALDLADGMFASSLAPWNQTGF